MERNEVKLSEVFDKEQEKNTGKNRIPKEKKKVSPLTVISIVICIILLPVLVLNVTLLVKSFLNEDEVPSIGGYSPMVVVTNSMEGTIDGGDLVIVKKVDPTTVEKGMIISFFDPASKTGTAVVTHRVYDVHYIDGELMFETIGDALNTGSPDDADDDFVPAENLVGVYVTHIPDIGNVILFMQTTPGLIIGIGIPLALLIGYDVLRRKSMEKEMAYEKDRLMKELEELKKGK